MGSTGKALYDALSCFHPDITNHNIFSYTAKEENEHIFDLAFELLRDICDEVTESKKAGCVRALMCWTSWQKACGVSNRGKDCNDKGNHVSLNDGDRDLWERAEDHKSSLEKSSGGSNYNECSTGDFADFF